MEVVLRTQPGGKLSLEFEEGGEKEVGIMEFVVDCQLFGLNFEVCGWIRNI